MPGEGIILIEFIKVGRYTLNLGSPIPSAEHPGLYKEQGSGTGHAFIQCSLPLTVAVIHYYKLLPSWVSVRMHYNLEL